MYDLLDPACKVFVHARDLDPKAAEQINLIRSHPALHGLIAVMPDAHAGAGCVIGFTGRFRQAVIPNIVGVDLGCGVLAHRLKGIEGIDFAALDAYIRTRIPLGMNQRENPNLLDTVSLGSNEPEAWKKLCAHVEEGFYREHDIERHISAEAQLGTLGGGNHFIEVDQGDEGFYLVVHSGSRNLGKRVAEFYQAKAVAVTRQMGVRVPAGMEYLPLTAGGDQYLYWAKVAQAYARYNRRMMVALILPFFGLQFQEGDVIESVHNYVSERDDVVRKGAISAHEGEAVIIPLNMADGIALGKGRGNSAYNRSAPHGAGRKFGRLEMKRKLERGDLSLADFERSMRHVFSTSVSRETFDESCFAYKPYDEIEEFLAQTVQVEQRLKPVYNLKASEEP